MYHRVRERLTWLQELDTDERNSSSANYNRAIVHIYMGHFDETMRQLDNAGEPDNPLVGTFRALALYYTGQTDAAAELMHQVISRRPNMHGVRPFLAMFLSAQGKHAEARAQLTDAVIRNAEVDPDIAYAVASVYAIEDMQDKAFEWLDRPLIWVTRTDRVLKMILTGLLCATIPGLRS